MRSGPGRQFAAPVKRRNTEWLVTTSATSLPQDLASGRYRPDWFKPDLLAGLTVAAMLVPQAMAYAELGGLPPSAGFRAALVALPIYALLGTSRHLGIGPEPGTAVMAALSVAPLAAGDPQRYLELMALLAGMVGLLAITGGLLRLGFVADLLSKPVLVGYISGVGLTLLSSQLRSFTGVDIESDSFFPRFWEFFTSLGEVDGTILALGLGSLAVILGLRRFRPALPGALLALTGAILTVRLFGIDVPLVGEIDAALPTFSIPVVSGTDVVSLLPAAFGLTLIGFTDNVLTARAIAAKQRYSIDSNRELGALGAMNLATAFGGGFPMSSSASRSIVPATIGSRSQMSSLVSFVTVIGFLLVGRSVLAEIPRPALAAVIVAAAIAVIDIAGFRDLIRVNGQEAALAVLTCVAVVTTDLLIGVLIAVTVAILIAMARLARPAHAALGEADALEGWIDQADPRANAVRGLLVYRFDAPLFFANAEHYRETLFDLADDHPGEERHIILDMEGIGSIDATAADHLLELEETLSDRDVSLAFARPNPDVLDVLHRCGLVDRLGRQAIHPTINAAVAAYREIGDLPDGP